MLVGGLAAPVWLRPSGCGRLAEAVLASPRRRGPVMVGLLRTARLSG